MDSNLVGKAQQNKHLKICLFLQLVGTKQNKRAREPCTAVHLARVAGAQCRVRKCVE